MSYVPPSILLFSIACCHVFSLNLNERAAMRHIPSCRKDNSAEALQLEELMLGTCSEQIIAQIRCVWGCAGHKASGHRALVESQHHCCVWNDGDFGAYWLSPKSVAFFAFIESNKVTMSHDLAASFF